MKSENVHEIAMMREFKRKTRRAQSWAEFTLFAGMFVIFFAVMVAVLVAG